MKITASILTTRVVELQSSSDGMTIGAHVDDMIGRCVDHGEPLVKIEVDLNGLVDGGPRWEGPRPTKGKMARHAN